MGARPSGRRGLPAMITRKVTKTPDPLVNTSGFAKTACFGWFLQVPRSGVFTGGSRFRIRFGELIFFRRNLSERVNTRLVLVGSVGNLSGRVNACALERASKLVRPSDIIVSATARWRACWTRRQSDSLCATGQPCRWSANRSRLCSPTSSKCPRRVP